MSKYYYDIFEDMEKYPDAWCIVAVGGRKTGKTYGTLKGCYERKQKFVFSKRTNRDVDLICSGSGQPLLLWCKPLGQRYRDSCTR